jgi:hypothetical protein
LRSRESGLSSSTGRSGKPGFRSAFLNASAMIAASAPEKGPVSVEGARDNVEAPSGETMDGARCAAGGGGAVGPAVVRSGD